LIHDAAGPIAIGRGLAQVALADDVVHRKIGAFGQVSDHVDGHGVEALGTQ